MRTIVYTSHARRPMTDAGLDAILRTARRNNATWGITGVLLYADRQFWQVVEGDEENLAILMNSIYADRRHKHVNILLDIEVPERRFEQWAMHLKTGDEADRAFRQDVDTILELMVMEHGGTR